MKIPGIASFYRENSSTLSEKHLISNTKLVIDAKSLCSRLYRAICCEKNEDSHLSRHFRNDIYGGNLVLLIQELELFKSNLEKCNIESHVLIIGTYQIEIDLVEGELASRLVWQYADSLREKVDFVYKQNLEDRLKIDSDKRNVGNHEKLLFRAPALWKVFQKACRRLWGERSRMVYSESDYNSFANEYQCLLLTDDDRALSNYLRCGFIPTDLFNYRELVRDETTGCCKIQCRLFDCTKESQVLPTPTNKNIALMKEIMEVERDDYQKFLREICRFKASNQLRVATAKTPAFKTDGSVDHKMIVTLFTWINVHKDPLEAFLRIISKSIRMRVTASFRKSLDPRGFLHPIESKIQFKKQICAHFRRGKFNGFTDPYIEHLMRMIDECKFSNTHSDKYFRATLTEEPLLEDPEQERIHLSTINSRPIAVLVAVMKYMTYEHLKPWQMPPQLAEDAVSYNVYNGFTYKRNFVAPMSYLAGFGSLDIYDFVMIRQLDESRRITLLECCFHVDKKARNKLGSIIETIFKQTFLKEAKICFLLLIFIRIETKSAVKVDFLRALWLTLLYYGYKNGAVKLPKNDAAKFSTLMEALEEFTVMPELKGESERLEGRETKFYRRIVHLICQLQMCYKWLWDIYDLIDTGADSPDSPLTKEWRTHHELFFNSTLIYRLTEQFMSSKSRDEKSFESLCAELPQISDACKTIFKIVSTTQDKKKHTPRGEADKYHIPLNYHGE